MQKLRFLLFLCFYGSFCANLVTAYVDDNPLELSVNQIMHYRWWMVYCIIYSHARYTWLTVSPVEQVYYSMVFRNACIRAFFPKALRNEWFRSSKESSESLEFSTSNFISLARVVGVAWLVPRSCLDQCFLCLAQRISMPKRNFSSHWAYINTVLLSLHAC